MELHECHIFLRCLTKLRKFRVLLFSELLDDAFALKNSMSRQTCAKIMAFASHQDKRLGIHIPCESAKRLQTIDFIFRAHVQKRLRLSRSPHSEAANLPKTCVQK